MAEATIENGFARVAAGDWLMGLSQPAACLGRTTVKCLRGFVVPDRAAVRQVNCAGEAWCGAAERPFLTRLDALPDVPLVLASKKLLVAPLGARSGARCVKLIPFSFSRSLAVTEFKLGWAVAATRSRVTRVALDEGATLTVRADSVVAWTGPNPTGFCPKLSILDILLPRGPRDLAWNFHGPAVVWFEGSAVPAPLTRSRLTA